MNEMAGSGAAAPGQVVLAGLSNGAFFARRAWVQSDREGSPWWLAPPARPAVHAACVPLMGTSDRNVPYAGGRPRGLPSWLAARRIRSILTHSSGREVVAAEDVCRDWAEVNASGAFGPARVIAAEADGGLPVERLAAEAEGAPPDILYRIVGGGHAWPGGMPSAPQMVFGRISRALDATGAVLDFARAAVQGPSGRAHP